MADSPAPRTAGRLPADLTKLCGAAPGLAEVKRLLSDSRLVTLTGVGGVGKTRLVQRVATAVRRAFSDGVWFIDLSAVRDVDPHAAAVEDPELLANFIAAELGLRQTASGAPLQLLVEHLANRNELLVLDNCERLIPECGVVASALLQACPQLRILATSREALGVSGETAYPVPPLITPGADREPTVAELMVYESVALFAARAEAANPGFQLTEDNHAAVAGICRRLDGVPLAIELAASWLRALTAHQILERLTDRFALLNWGNRSGPDRQQTLRACVDWSFESCTLAERLLWSRLSVFVGDSDLEAIEGVCADPELPKADVLGLVAGLVDKSVLTLEEHGEVARYRMLETIREYGWQHLAESGDRDALRRRHLEWHQQLVERARADWVNDPRGYCLDRLWRAQPNLRAAVDFCLGELDQPDQALRLVTALPWPWWWGQGYFAEGRRWLRLGLAKAECGTALRARALVLGAELSLGQGDTSTATRLLEEGTQLAQRLQDTPTIAHADAARGLAVLFHGEPHMALDPLLRARDALSSGQRLDTDQLLFVLLTLGLAAAHVRDRDLAETCRSDILAITRGGPALGQAMFMFGVIAWTLDDSQQAGEDAEACLRFARDHGLSGRHSSAWAVEVLAWVAGSQGKHRRAATLLGAAEALLADIGSSVVAFPHLMDYHGACEQQARDALGSAFDENILKGRTMSYEDAVTYALGAQPKTPATDKDLSRKELTRREREVAELLAEGRSNKEIAAALVVSQRTAESHVEHILTKLGFTSRSQVASWVAAQHTNNGSR